MTAKHPWPYLLLSLSHTHTHPPIHKITDQKLKTSWYLMASIQSVILDQSAVSASFSLFVYLIMRSHTVQYAIPGSAILRMCRPTLSSFPSSSPTFSDGHNSQFHAFFMFSLNGSPRSTTICLEAMLDVKPHNALRTPFPEAGKCILDSSPRYSCAKTRRRSETDPKFFGGFRFFFGGNFF